MNAFHSACFWLFFPFVITNFITLIAGVQSECGIYIVIVFLVLLYLLTKAFQKIETKEQEQTRLSENTSD